MKPRTWMITLLTLIACIVIIYMALIFRYYRLPVSGLWINNCMKIKEDRIRKIQGNKIVFAGGSATLFGVRTLDIQKELGIPTVNMAVHAGLDIDYILERLKRSLREGDVVILPLEYELFSYDNVPSRVKLEYIFTYDRPYLRSLPLLDVCRFTLSVKMDSLLEAMRELGMKGYSEPPVGNGWTYSSGSLNENGDETYNSGNKKFEAAIINIPLGEHRVRKGLQIIKEFSEWCRLHNIALYVSYANTVYHEDYEKDFYRDYFTKRLKSFMAQNNINILGEPYDFFFDKALFYDSYYHLNDIGMTIRTKKLTAMIRELEPVRKMSNMVRVRDSIVVSTSRHSF